MKKGIALLLAGCILMSMLTGCGNSTDNKTEEVSGQGRQEENQEQVHLTFLTNEAAGDEQHLEYYEQLISNFESKNPGITVELLQGGDWQDMETKLNAAMLSNTYPDVILCPLNTFGQRAALGDFMDLSEYIEGWEDKEDIFDASIDIGKYQGISYGIGGFPVPEVVMYRKDYFKEAGLDPNSPPETWEELYDYAKKLVVMDDSGNVERGGFDVPISDPNVTLMEVFMRQAGNKIIDSEKGEICIDQPSAIKAMEFLKKFIDEKLTITYQRGTDDPVLSGKSAIGIVYLDSAKKILEEDPSMKDKLGFFPYLNGGEEAAFTGYRVMAVSETCKNKEAAWKFAKYFYNSDEMWNRYEKFGNIPVRVSLSDKYIQENPELNKVVMASVEKGTGRPVSGWVSVVTKYEVQAYEEIMNGVKEPEQALKDAAEAARAEIDSQQ